MKRSVNPFLCFRYFLLEFFESSLKWIKRFRSFQNYESGSLPSQYSDTLRNGTPHLTRAWQWVILQSETSTNQKFSRNVVRLYLSKSKRIFSRFNPVNVNREFFFYILTTWIRVRKATADLLHIYAGWPNIPFPLAITRRDAVSYDERGKFQDYRWPFPCTIIPTWSFMSEGQWLESYLCSR